MDQREAFEEIRAWAEGEMDPEERARFEAAMAAAPALRKAAEEYRSVHSLTRVLEDVPVSCRTTLEDMERLIERDAAPGAHAAGRAFGFSRRTLAAAGILLALGGGLLLLRALADRGDDGWGRVRFQAIAPPTGDVVDDSPGAIPDLLADYRPVDGGTIRWLDSLDEGRRTARITGRPLMVFGMWPDCEDCDLIRQTALKEGAVLAALEDFIPVEVDLSRLPAKERVEMMKCGYPVLEVQAEDGTVVTSFCGLEGAKGMAGHLDEGWTLHTATRRPLAWDTTRSLARSLDEAHALEQAGRLGEAHREYEILLARANPGAFRRAAAAGQGRIARAAYETIRRAIAGEGAVSEVEDAAQRFAGSPFGADFEALLESQRRRGAWPEITFPGS